MITSLPVSGETRSFLWPALHSLLKREFETRSINNSCSRQSLVSFTFVQGFVLCAVCRGYIVYFWNNILLDKWCINLFTVCILLAYANVAYCSLCCLIDILQAGGELRMIHLFEVFIEWLNAIMLGLFDFKYGALSADLL